MQTYRQFIEAQLTEHYDSLSLLGRMRARFAERIHPGKAVAELFSQSQEEKLIPADASLDTVIETAPGTVGAIDLEKLAAFIKEVLPLILQFIMAFR